MNINAIVLLAEGFEEVEAVTPADYLRRAGFTVTIAAIGSSLAVKGARGITVHADITLQELIQQGKASAAEWDALIIPGGMPGAANIGASKDAEALITGMAAAGKYVCAICAAPAVVLAPLGILKGKKFTCYPGMEGKVQGSIWSDDSVVIDKNIITSRAAGTAGAFAVAIIGQILGETERDRISQTVLL